jgi:glutamyl-tRNA reductase
MIDLTATHFAAHHPRRMTFANRTRSARSTSPTAFSGGQLR